MIELLLPKKCAGCGRPGAVLCEVCRTRIAQPPQRVFTTVDPHIPVWAFGTYSGPHRSLVLGMKERGRRDVPGVLGPMLYAGLEFLAVRGEIPEPEEVELVPAPTRRSSARKRGGDPVTAVCRSSGLSICNCVEHATTVKDSVGLDATSRRRNLAGGVLLTARPTRPVLIVDDVVTTGATIASTAAVLMTANIEVSGAICVCFA